MCQEAAGRAAPQQQQGWGGLQCGAGQGRQGFWGTKQTRSLAVARASQQSSCKSEELRDPAKKPNKPGEARTGKARYSNSTAQAVPELRCSSWARSMENLGQAPSTAGSSQSVPLERRPSTEDARHLGGGYGLRPYSWRWYLNQHIIGLLMSFLHLCLVISI